MLLDPIERQALARRLAALAGPVGLVLFTRTEPSPTGATLGQLLAEVAELNSRLTLERHDFVEGASLAYRYDITRVPALIVEGARDYGLRYFGSTAALPPAALVDLVLDVGRGDADVDPGLRRRLERLIDPMRITVLVEADCHACASTARAAQRVAMVSSEVRAEVVEAAVFPDVAAALGVTRLPATVVQGRPPEVGRLGEADLVDRLTAGA